jgi:hypothetical protein
MKKSKFTVISIIAALAIITSSCSEEEVEKPIDYRLVFNGDYNVSTKWEELGNLSVHGTITEHFTTTYEEKNKSLLFKFDQFELLVQKIVVANNGLEFDFEPTTYKDDDGNTIYVQGVWKLSQGENIVYHGRYDTETNQIHITWDQFYSKGKIRRFECIATKNK